MPHSRQKHCQKKFDKPPLFLNPIQRRILAATTLMVCVLYLIGGEPRQAAALVRKYHTILWDKPTAARLYDFFASASGVPPQEPSTDRQGRVKAVVKPLPDGFVPKGKFVPMAGGDTQATATCISALPYTDTGTTVGATDDYNLPADTTSPTLTAGCATLATGAGPAGSLPRGAVYTGTGTAPDVVYSMSFPSGNPDTLTITMDPTGSQDLALIVYCNTVSSSLADGLCVDDTGVGGVAESVTVGNIAAGTTLYIVVDGYSTGGTPPGPSGPYMLSVTSTGATQPSCGGGGGGCTLTCPSNIVTSNSAGQCGAVVTFGNPTTSGSCGTVNVSPPSGSFFPVGTTMVTATSTLGGGSCSFTVTVNDTEPPTVTCPADIVVPASSGAGTPVDFSPDASDNCPGVTIDAVPPSGSVFAIGTTTVNVTATDAAGNMATCSFTVTVQGVEQERVYVADTLNDRVQVFEPTGGDSRFLPNLVGPWHLVPGTTGTAGSSNGQFRRPEAITANADGSRIYVADTGNNRIQYTTNSGGTWQNFATIGSTANQVRAPQGLALDLDGNLYVADTGNNRILFFAGGEPGTGVVIATAGSTLGKVNNPRGVAVDADRNLYVADTGNNRIQLFTTASTTPTPVLFASTGSGLNPGQVRAPEGVAVDDEGSLYVADTGNNRVIAFMNVVTVPGPTATLLLNVGSTFGKVRLPEGVVVAKGTVLGGADTDSALIVADTANNRIQGSLTPLDPLSYQLVEPPFGGLGSGIGYFRSPSKIR